MSSSASAMGASPPIAPMVDAELPRALMAAPPVQPELAERAKDQFCVLPLQYQWVYEYEPHCLGHSAILCMALNHHFNSAGPEGRHFVAERQAISHWRWQSAHYSRGSHDVAGTDRATTIGSRHCRTRNYSLCLEARFFRRLNK